MNLDQLGLKPGKEGVAILVGPNGSGKSNFLKTIATSTNPTGLSVVSNTARDRFAGVRNLRRISAFNSPRSVIKQAIAVSLRESSARFYEAGAVLAYCGYHPRFGFSAIKTRREVLDFGGVPSSDQEAAIAFLGSVQSRQVVWIDQSDSKLSFSLGRDFSAVLRNERWLRHHGLLREPIQVHLERRDGLMIELQDASSGELSLISSLVFLSTAERDHPPVFLIDEPENSLHPNWQREYVERVMTSTYYRQPHVVIATHAPLVVTGALAWSKDVVGVFQMVNGWPQPISLEDSTPTSIEEVLWRAFDVVTPANHFVSEQLAELVTRFGQGQVTREEALAVVSGMNRESFDPDQRAFFEAVVELIGKIGKGQALGVEDA
ncbi:ATP-binding protein [Mesorhizobium opportunistum]|uniref:AAA family ATPase n=1 Tax=Mesorhizobium opportunistum TaxID=593909 RepID=UPI003335952E